MTASTQRFTIKQDWQQVATGNVTLIGCNTAANYHINVGADKPTIDSAFDTDKLTDGKDFNYNAPVWVKLDVDNQIDEADLLVIGEAVVPVNTPIITNGIFTMLQNCSYDGVQLNYTGGAIDNFGNSYQASTDKIDSKLQLTKIDNYLTIFAGDKDNYAAYTDGSATGISLVLQDTGVAQINVDGIVTNGTFDEPIFQINSGNIFQIHIENSSIVIDNITKGTKWTSPQSSHLTYCGVFMAQPQNLPIKVV